MSPNICVHLSGLYRKNKVWQLAQSLGLSHHPAMISPGKVSFALDCDSDHIMEKAPIGKPIGYQATFHEPLVCDI